MSFGLYLKTYVVRLLHDSRDTNKTQLMKSKINKQHQNNGIIDSAIDLRRQKI